MRGPASLQGSGRRGGGCVAHEGSQRSHCSLALHKFPASQTNTAWSCPQPASQVEKLRVSGEPGLLLSKRWSGLRSPGEVFSQSRGCSTSPPSGLGTTCIPQRVAISGHVLCSHQTRLAGPRICEPRATLWAETVTR